MDIMIVRGKSTEEGTPGKLDSGAGFICDTLELEWQNNKTGMSCIISDTYHASVWFSPHLNRKVIRLEDKHGRKDCLLHNMNFAGEGTGEITQVHGCTGVGEGFGYITRPDGGGTQWGIENSGSTLASLIAHIEERAGNAMFTVTYSWGEGCESEDMRDLNPLSDTYTP